MNGKTARKIRQHAKLIARPDKVEEAVKKLKDLSNQGLIKINKS